MKVRSLSAPLGVAGLIGIAGLVGVLSHGCGSPEFRVDVQTIPESTTQLEVAAYVGGALVSYPSLFEVAGPAESFSFGIRLSDGLSGDTTISVAARDAQGCILALGTADPAKGSTLATKVTVPLTVPNPAFTDPVCKIGQPVIMAALRREEGPLSNLQNSIVLQGWNFQPNASVTMTSSAIEFCNTNAADCLTRCPSRCAFTVGMRVDNMGGQTDMGASDMGTSNECVTGCAVVPTLNARGPALLEMNLDSSLNTVVSNTDPKATTTSSTPQISIGLLSLISQPLTITVSNPDQTKTPAFTEVAPVRGDVMVGQ